MRDFLFAEKKEPEPMIFNHVIVAAKNKKMTKLCLFCQKPLGLKDHGHMHTHDCVNSFGDSRHNTYIGLGPQYG